MNEKKLIFISQLDSFEIEKEQQDDIEFPFDPGKIDIVNEQYTVFNLIERIKNNEIDMMPDFQRHQNLWNDIQQSRLIESLMLGIPLQSFYFDVELVRDDTNRRFFSQRQIWHVVDGLQRLSAMRNFIVGKMSAQGSLLPMKLKGMEYLTQLNDMSFSDLPGSLQRSIYEARVQVSLIRPMTPEDIKFNLFKRVNTGGLPLTQQEIRHALFHGIGTKFLEELSLLESFRNATESRISAARMLDREFVNRFCAFYLLDVEESYRTMDVFLNDALRVLNVKTPDELKVIKCDFDHALRIICDKFVGIGFKRYQIEKQKWSKLINKSIFDALTAEIARLPLKERERLMNRPNLLDHYKLLCKKDDAESFSVVVSRSTGNKRQVIARHRIIRDFLHAELEGLE